jgi:protein TonB
MFGQLLESRAKPQRHRGGIVVSIVGHALFIALAVTATRTQLTATGPGERLDPPLVLNPPASPQPARTAQLISPSTSTSSRTVVAPLIPPVDIPLPDIPTFDAPGQPLPGIEWTSDGAGTRSGNATSGAGGTEEGIPFAPGVDKPAIAHAGNPSPRYPEVLRRANVTGEVVVQVVIDTSGRADMGTLKVLSSAHPLLTESVLATIPRARFIPAETGGRKVRMWVLQSFVFTLER